MSALISMFKKFNRAARRDRPSTLRPEPSNLITLACQQKRPLKVSVDGAEDKYSSLFVAMKNEREFYIDYLSPKYRLEYLEPGETLLSAEFDLNGLQYDFSARYLGLEVYGGFDSIRLAIPKQIRESQRRDFYRVEPRGNAPAQVIVNGGYATRAINISGGGVAFPMDHAIDPGTVVPLRLMLPKRDEIKAEFEIIDAEEVDHRLFAAAKDSRMYQVRGRFKQLASKYTQMILTYVADRQRETIHILN